MCIVLCYVHKEILCMVHNQMRLPDQSCQEGNERRLGFDQECASLVHAFDGILCPEEGTEPRPNSAKEVDDDDQSPFVICDFRAVAHPTPHLVMDVMLLKAFASPRLVLDIMPMKAFASPRCEVPVSP